MANSMAKMSDTDKFMDNFNPDNSNRERRKKMRTQQQGNGSEKGNGNNKRDKKARSLYNEKGLLIHDGFDLCDCLNDKCPGCFFPCPKCRSPKCGTECRINRKYVLESYSVDGTSIIVENKHIPSSTCK